MNKKILFGVILFIVAIFMSAGMSLIDAPIPLFFNLIQLIVAFAGVSIILKGMAEGKKISKVYRYYGELNTLLGIVEKSITKMDLKVKNKSITDNSFYFSLSERIWVSFFAWPVHLDIKAEKSGQMIDLNIHAWYQLDSILQAKYTQKKAQEFLDLVKNYAGKVIVAVADESSEKQFLEDFKIIQAENERFLKGEIPSKNVEIPAK